MDIHYDLCFTKKTEQIMLLLQPIYNNISLKTKETLSLIL